MTGADISIFFFLYCTVLYCTVYIGREIYFNFLYMYMCVCVYVCMCVCVCWVRVLGGVRDACVVCNRKLKLKMRCVKDEGYKINTITIYNV